MSEPEANINKRPRTITVICILGFIGVLSMVPMIFLHGARQIAPWYRIYLMSYTIAGLVCLIGLWKMKKWAAYAYTGFFIANQIVLFSLGIWTFISVIMPVIVIAFVFKNLQKMT